MSVNVKRGYRYLCLAFFKTSLSFRSGCYYDQNQITKRTYLSAWGLMKTCFFLVEIKLQCCLTFLTITRANEVTCNSQSNIKAAQFTVKFYLPIKVPSKSIQHSKIDSTKNNNVKYFQANSAKSYTVYPATCLPYSPSIL